MKKQIYFLVSLFALIGFSMNVIGQTSSGFRPFVGDVKTYKVASHSANTYTWTLTTSATDATSGDLLVAGTIASAPTGYNEGTGKNSITITWVNPTVPTIYYLHVVESDGTCTNHKVLAIQPQNNFKLEIANIGADNADRADPFVECAPTVTINKWNGTGTVDDLAEAQNFEYNYGTKVFYYRIKATGINFATTTWNADFTVAETAGGTVAVDYVTGSSTVAPVWTGAISGGTGSNAVVVPVDKDALYVRVTISNGTANETLSDESITTTIAATSKENLGNQTAIIADPSSIQTQKARPDTGSIHE